MPTVPATKMPEPSGIRKQLFTGSLQDHMRASRKEMNQSYVNQQNQLMSMNVVREAQRLQLSQADTIVKLNQLKEEVIKTLPPKNVRVVVPTSNAALEDTLLEEKEPAKRSQPTPIRTKSIPDLAAQVLASKGKPSAAKANSRASSNANSRTSSQYGSAETSPTASETPTIGTSTTAQYSSPTSKLYDIKEKLKALGDKDSKIKNSMQYMSLVKSNPTKTDSMFNTINNIQEYLDSNKIEGSGLRSHRKKVSLIRAKNGRFTKR